MLALYVFHFEWSKVTQPARPYWKVRISYAEVLRHNFSRKSYQTLPIVMVRIFKNNAAFVSFVLFYNTRLFKWGIVEQHSAFSGIQSAKCL